MCLFNPTLISMCTDKDRVCYKIERAHIYELESNILRQLINFLHGKRKNTNVVWRSVYQNFEYLKNKKYSIDNHIQIIRDDEYYLHRIAGGAFHSYTTKKKARRGVKFIKNNYMKLRIVKCIIPAGSEVYINPIEEEYASSSIIVKNNVYFF